MTACGKEKGAPRGRPLSTSRGSVQGYFFFLVAFFLAAFFFAGIFLLPPPSVDREKLATAFVVMHHRFNIRGLPICVKG